MEYKGIQFSALRLYIGRMGVDLMFLARLNCDLAKVNRMRHNFRNEE